MLLHVIPVLRIKLLGIDVAVRFAGWMPYLTVSKHRRSYCRNNSSPYVSGERLAMELNVVVMMGKFSH